MNPKELRLGNYVGIEGNISTYEVIGIQSDSVRIKNLNSDIEYTVSKKLICPLHINFGILGSLGFKNWRSNWPIKDGISYINENNSLLLEYCNGVFISADKVHELQNLHFAITGEELIYNIKNLNINNV